MTDLHNALKRLNAAAYAALRAGNDTTAYPDLNRAALRRLCSETDRLVDTRGESTE